MRKAIAVENTDKCPFYHDEGLHTEREGSRYSCGLNCDCEGINGDNCPLNVFKSIEVWRVEDV